MTLDWKIRQHLHLFTGTAKNTILAIMTNDNASDDELKSLLNDAFDATNERIDISLSQNNCHEHCVSTFLSPEIEARGIHMIEKINAFNRKHGIPPLTNHE